MVAAASDGAKRVAEHREIAHAGQREQATENQGVARRHAAGRNRPCHGPVHERVEAPFPPLIESGGTGGGQRRSENGMEKAERINGVGGGEIIADSRGEQNQQREPRFHQFREISQDAPA